MESINSKRGIIYCRVSSVEQVAGTSLDSQEQFCREYAQRNEIEVVKVFIEKGESAKTIHRTEFTKAIALCANKKSKIDYFIVYKLDRFARNQEDHVATRAFLKKSNTELRSATEPISEDPTGKLMEGIISVFAEFDNNVRTERTKAGMQACTRKGIWVWKAPLGYHKPRGATNIEPDPNTAPYILLAFEEYSKGTYTYKSLASYLAERGFQTSQGKFPSKQLMEKILKNPIYTGIINMWGERSKGAFDPIVSVKLFEGCGNSRQKNSNHATSPRSTSNPLFPLKKITACSGCKQPFTASSPTGKQGKKYPYYHHFRQDCAKARFIPKENFEQSFVEHLNNITPTKRYEKLFKGVVLNIWQSNYKKFDENNARVRKGIDRLEGERQKVFSLHRKGIYTDEEFIDQKKRVNSRIDQKHLLLQESRVEEFNMEEALNYCFRFVGKTSKTWIKGDLETKIRFQKMIFKGKTEFDGEKFGNPELSPIYALNKEYAGKKSKLVAPRGIEPLFSG